MMNTAKRADAVFTKRILRSSASVVGLLWSCAGLLGCEYTVDKTTENGTPSVESAETNTNTVASATMWPSYYAPTYFGHGYGSEDSDRQAAIDAARAAGLNCIRVDAPEPPSDEVAMHLLHFKSPVDGHLLAGSWYDIALQQGISRYVINIGDGSEFARWQFLTKDYPANTIQWLVNDAVVAQ